MIAVQASGASQRSTHMNAIAAFSYPDNAAPRPSLVFMPDGTSYAERSADNKKIVVKDIATGKESRVLFDVGYTRETTLPDFEGFTIINLYNDKELELPQNPGW